MKDNYFPGGEEMFFISLQRNKNSEKTKIVLISFFVPVNQEKEMLY
jgi:hypothetical protein